MAPEIKASNQYRRREGQWPASTRCSLTSAAMTEVRAEITANVWQVRTEVGASVVEGDELIILESMKMEIPVTAPHDAIVTEVRVAPEDKVQEGDIVAVLEPSS
jgi:urea carboxylase